MIDKKELLEKIDKERQIWLDYYTNVDIYLYAIVGACYRAGAQFKEDETKIVTKDKILTAVDNSLTSVDDDTECLNDIFNIVLNSDEHIKDFVLKELSDAPKDKGIEVAAITLEEAFEKIEQELIARKNISNESLIRLQTLQWFKDIIEDNKKEA